MGINYFLLILLFSLYFKLGNRISDIITIWNSNGCIVWATNNLLCVCVCVCLGLFIILMVENIARDHYIMYMISFS